MASTVTTSKRQRGRPSKDEAAAATEQISKRKRGRPPKELAPLLSGKLDRAKLKQIEAQKEQRIKKVR
jgi:hypothetical protein